MKTIGASDVAKKGVSRVSSISLKQKFFGAGKWIVSPSSAWRRSAHAIIVGFHRVIQKKDFCLFRANPCEGARCWITERVINYFQWR